MSNLEHLERIVAGLPEAKRVDIEAWGGEPTFRVGGKNFIFASHDGTRISVKLSRDEAAAVVATDPDVTPTAYGLGRHGWVSVSLGRSLSRARLAGGRGVDSHLVHPRRPQTPGPIDLGSGHLARLS